MNCARTTIPQNSDWMYLNHRGSQIRGSSRHWFAYQLNSLYDLPAGFHIQEPPRDWRKAIFIPGPARGGNRKLNDFSRVFVLASDGLTVYTHQASNEPPFVAQFDELVEVVSEKMPFCGALELSTFHGRGRFLYESVHQKLMNSLLRAIRSAWLPETLESKDAFDQQGLESELEARCRYALRLELDPNESILGVFLEQPKKAPLQFALPRRHPSAAAYLIFTNRRVLSVSDTPQKKRISIRYAIVSVGMSAEIAPSEAGTRLCINFAKDHVWRMCLATTNVLEISALYHLCAMLHRISPSKRFASEKHRASDAACPEDIHR